MMLDENGLRDRLSAIPSTAPAPPLAQVHARARQLRATRRRVRLGGGALVACGGLALAGPVQSLLPSAGTGPAGVAPAASGRQGAAGATPSKAAAGQDCTSGFAAKADLTAVADLLYLPVPGSVRDPLVRPVLARQERLACPPAPVAALWYSLTGNVSTRRVELRGPGAPRPAGQFVGDKRTLRARGTTIELDVLPREQGRDVNAYWSEPDGTAWAAYTHGLAPDAVATLLEGLTIEDGRLATSAPPAGLDVAVPVSDGPKVSQTLRRFMVNFRHQNQDQGGWSVEVSSGGGPLEGRGTRVSVGGRDAWWLGGPNGKGGGLWWRGPHGEQIGITGTITLQRALQVARALQPVPADDARLVAARER